MTSNRFFITQANFNTSYVWLEGEEHHHLSRVSRIKPKEKVWLLDKRGISYLARVEEINKDRTKLLILEKKDQEVLKLKITLAQALIKSKKMELIIQKSAELGLTHFIPMITSRSVVKIEGKIEKKLQRWQKIAYEAAKQCGSSWVLRIQPLHHLKTLVTQKKEKKNILLSENQGEYLKEILLQEKNPPSSILILVGPEGGWAEEEEEYILNNGFEAVSLGRNILRTETAAISSLALISHFWNL
ncbi:MAG: 16S rRNA (uracil(1498)-N(3))-methyltransferase [Candidatus Aminicenantaceae bacterium]